MDSCAKAGSAKVTTINTASMNDNILLRVFKLSLHNDFRREKPPS
jgi:hypothetical protein